MEPRALPPWEGMSHPVRSGDHVYRDAGSWSPTIHALLHHLRDTGIAPLPLGFDEKGREILSWMHGETIGRPWPESIRSTEGINQLGALVARLHRALDGFDPGPNARWRIGPRRLRPGEIVRHGDLGPWNTVMQRGQLIGFIDWDMAEPGSVLEDIAQVAWAWLPLRSGLANSMPWGDLGFNTEPPLGQRLAALCEGYGWADHSAVLQAVLVALDRSKVRIETWGKVGLEPWASFLKAGFVERNRADFRWLYARREGLLAGV